MLRILDYLCEADGISKFDSASSRSRNVTKKTTDKGGKLYTYKYYLCQLQILYVNEFESCSTNLLACPRDALFSLLESPSTYRSVLSVVLHVLYTPHIL